jgi:hypothetical protein
MVDVIRFYNKGGRGDLHVSRGFVDDIAKNTDLKVFYHHQYNQSILKDISIQQEPLNDGLNEHDTMIYKYGTIYFNTSYGMNKPTTLQCLYDNFTSLYDLLNIKQKSLIYYLPKIEYNQFDRDKIDNFIEGKKYVLMCNNQVVFGKMDNFDMNPLINLVSKKYRNITFIVTNDDVYINYKRIRHKNVVYFKDIVEKDDNLNEISYLSTKCNIIIGRNSGPHTFCYVEDNMNRAASFVSFSYRWWPFYDMGLSRVCKNTNFFNILPHLKYDEMLFQLEGVIKGVLDEK